MHEKIFEVEIGGKILSAQFNNLADQANGSVMLSYGDTVVLATAVISKKPKEGIDFFPLTVDYEEKFYAAGKMPGSRFVRRETKPSDDATLTSRVIDRTIRPLFPDHLRHDVHVVVTVLSINEDDPDILAINAASLALATSDIPWNGPTSAVRITCHTDNTFRINPTYAERGKEDFEADMICCGKEGIINMIEMGGKEIAEAVAEDMLVKAQEEIEKFQAFQKKIVNEISKVKIILGEEKLGDEAKRIFEQDIAQKLADAVTDEKSVLSALKDDWMNAYKEISPEGSSGVAIAYWEKSVDDAVHKLATEKDARVDGREFSEIRSLYAQAGGLSKVLHGTGVFYRGGTHVVSVLTLGGPGETQMIDGIEEQVEKRFMHHYNFPPFSTGETGRMGVNRRMIGHGALAEKALSYVLPSREDFPYTVRIVSEVVASNGSSSMGSVCAGTLALMDAGVPILRPVAGIAMGLMMKDHKTYKILTDIQGPEDHYGDMDLKVAGTEKGITAMQMDVKVDGVPLEILREALESAKQARLHILKKIMDALPAPRTDLSETAPRIITIKIKESQIGLVIGPGGKMVNKIKDETGTEIDIEENGLVFITGKNGKAQKAHDIIESLTHEYTVGEKVQGEVVKLFEFGALVKLGPSSDGLVHISEIAPFHIDKVTDVLKEGDIVPVIVKEIDKDRGRISLSIKQISPDFVKKPDNTL